MFGQAKFSKSKYGKNLCMNLAIKFIQDQVSTPQTNCRRPKFQSGFNELLRLKFLRAFKGRQSYL